MQLLGDNSPLTNILLIAVAAGVGVGAWFLLGRLVDLLPANAKRPVEGHDDMDMLRAASIAQQQFAIQPGGSNSATINLGRFNTGQRRSRSSARVAFVVAVVSGVIALLLFANTLAFVSSAVSVQGKVVELRQTQCQQAICYAPRVRFIEAVGGRQVEFLSPASSNPPAFHVDEQVTVLYSPDWPQHARIQGLFSIWGGVIIVFAVSIAFAVFGACMLLFPNAIGSGYSGFGDASGSGSFDGGASCDGGGSCGC